VVALAASNVLGHPAPQRGQCRPSVRRGHRQLFRRI